MGCPGPWVDHGLPARPKEAGGARGSTVGRRHMQHTTSGMRFWRRQARRTFRARRTVVNTSGQVELQFAVWLTAAVADDSLLADRRERLILLDQVLVPEFPAHSTAPLAPCHVHEISVGLQQHERSERAKQCSEGVAAPSGVRSRMVKTLPWMPHTSEPCGQAFGSRSTVGVSG